MNTEVLIEKVLRRMPGSIDHKDRFSCGFRHEGRLFVAELVREDMTDKLDHVEATFKVTVFVLDTERKEKVGLPRLPHEKRIRRLMLPRKLEVCSTTFTERFTK